MQQSIRQAMETVENVHRTDAAESDDLEQRLTGSPLALVSYVQLQ